MRDIALKNVGVATSTGDPRIAGRTQVIVNVNIDFEEFEGNFQGALELWPAAYDGQGSWVGLFRGEIPGKPIRIGDVDTFVDAIIIAHGTGVFEGLKLRFEHFVDVNLPGPAEVPAECSWPGEYWRGEIIELPT